MHRKYSEYLDKKFLKTNTPEHLQKTLEKFIMNFEIHYILSDIFDFTTRGGMAMSFYQSDYVTRLSEDMDMTVNILPDEMKKIMDDVIKKMPYGIEPQSVNPPTAPVLSWYLSYKSVLGGMERIKLDFLCDPDMYVESTKIFEIGFDVKYFKTKHKLKVLDSGILLADKLSSLAMHTIGYGMNRQENMPKQIFDIAILLKMADHTSLIQTAYSFKLMTNQKCMYYKIKNVKNDWTIQDVIKDIRESLCMLINTNDSISLTTDATDKYSSFKKGYIGVNLYSKHDYFQDLLLILLFVIKLEDLINGKLSTNDFVRELTVDINDAESFMDKDHSSIIQMEKALRDDFPNSSNIKKLAVGYEQKRLFLLYKIESLRLNCLTE